MRSARRSSRRASGLGTIALACRVKRVTPSSSSSFLMATLKDGWAMRSSFAALVKLPCRATASQ
jgi:hypothetical protein